MIYGFEGLIVLPGGAPFEISDTAIDDAFNNDGSFRWLSDFVSFAVREPKQRPQKRVLQRLRLIDLAVRISEREDNTRSQRNRTFSRTYAQGKWRVRVNHAVGRSKF